MPTWISIIRSYECEICFRIIDIHALDEACTSFVNCFFGISLTERYNDRRWKKIRFVPNPRGEKSSQRCRKASVKNGRSLFRKNRETCVSYLIFRGSREIGMVRAPSPSGQETATGPSDVGGDATRAFSYARTPSPSIDCFVRDFGDPIALEGMHPRTIFQVLVWDFEISCRIYCKIGREVFFQAKFVESSSI